MNSTQELPEPDILSQELKVFYNNNETKKTGHNFEAVKIIWHLN